MKNILGSKWILKFIPETKTLLHAVHWALVIVQEPIVYVNGTPFAPRTEENLHNNIEIKEYKLNNNIEIKKYKLNNNIEIKEYKLNNNIEIKEYKLNNNI